MRTKSCIICIVVLLINLVNIGADFKDYDKLKINEVSSIKSSDLPSEFGAGAFKTVDEFIRKTAMLNYEWIIYFDFITGEILKCGKGEMNEVQIDFEDGEFDGHNIASLHNHPISAFSPPSGKNFGILKRDFEDYELIAGKDWFWVFKAKGNHDELLVEFNVASIKLFNLAREYTNNFDLSEDMIEDICDVVYGDLLSKYINDKNINDIQLIKRMYNHDY